MATDRSLFHACAHAHFAPRSAPAGLPCRRGRFAAAVGVLALTVTAVTGQPATAGGRAAHARAHGHDVITGTGVHKWLRPAHLAPGDTVTVHIWSAGDSGSGDGSGGEGGGGQGHLGGVGSPGTSGSGGGGEGTGVYLRCELTRDYPTLRFTLGDPGEGGVGGRGGDGAASSAAGSSSGTGVAGSAGGEAMALVVH